MIFLGALRTGNAKLLRSALEGWMMGKYIVTRKCKGCGVSLRFPPHIFRTSVAYGRSEDFLKTWVTVALNRTNTLKYIKKHIRKE